MTDGRKPVSRDDRTNRRCLDAATITAVLMIASFAAGTAAAEDRFGLGSDPNAVVIEYLERIGGIESEDPGPSVQVFANGRILVHIPDFMNGAGNYETQLNSSQLHALVRRLVNGNLVEFDGRLARDNRRRAIEQSPVLSATTDGSTIEIALHLDRYTARGPGALERRGVSKRISWYGLRHDAAHYPEVPQLHDLALSQQLLEALIKRSDLRPVAAD